MANTNIEWTETTWNPIAGCSILSPGCSNCYAVRMAHRLEAAGVAKYRGTTRRSKGRTVWTGRINVDDRALDAPLAWTRPRRIFVNSMSDLFHESVPVGVIRRVWDVMGRTGQHTYQILTKRPKRMREVLNNHNFAVLPNVWLGVSVENAEYMWRLDELRRVPARIRFVSFEPLLGLIGSPDLVGVDWAIVGGESGPRARPMEPAWVDEIHRACIEHGVAFFFKQWGGVNKIKTGRLLHGRTWDEYPVRENERGPRP